MMALRVDRVTRAISVVRPLLLMIGTIASPGWTIGSAILSTEPLRISFAMVRMPSVPLNRHHLVVHVLCITITYYVSHSIYKSCQFQKRVGELPFCGRNQ